MPDPTVRFEAVGNVVTLVRETPSRLPFGSASAGTVPVDQWVIARPAPAAAAVARLLQAIEDGEMAGDGRPMATVEANRAILHPAFIACLNDSEAVALGLPPATRLSLNLRSSGLIHKDGFRIETEWTRAGGVRERATIAEHRLHHAGKEWRIPEPLFSTILTVARVNTASDASTRQAALADLKTTIGQDAAARIATDGHIDRLRLSYASGFSLVLRAGAAGFDFDPVLFGRERLEAAANGDPLDEGADSLLPPALAADFMRRFRNGDGTRATYLLGDGSILYIDPQLTRVLGTVRRAQDADPDTRRAFAAAPQRYIAEALQNAGDTPADAACLFVETQQFSQRVAGIDLWRKPVLPWIKPKPSSWLPERFGLRIGDGDDARTITIPPERIDEAATAATNALREARASFQFEGETIPATRATVASLESLSELTAAARTATRPGNTDDQLPAPLRQRYFLQVRDNLDDLSYSPLTGTAPSAAPPPPAELPTSLRSAPKPHQVTGFRWLADCWRANMPGALLADDMGLGKTYQALAFVAWIREQQAHPAPVLIVAPTGLLANWRAEILQHLEPDALGRLIGAYGRELGELRGEAGRDIDSGASALDPAAWEHAGIVLTTYETMRDYHLSFARLRFSAILYDEAQKLKNPASQITRAAKTLNARFSLAMTGTPVENRLQDLWSIFDVVHPGLLGSSKSFEQTYLPEPKPLEALRDRLTEPQGVIPPVLLRRLKEECLGSLPRKILQAMPMPMPPRQAAAYDRAVHQALAVKGTGERGRMLEVLAALRGVSLHPVNPGEAGEMAEYWTDSARLCVLFEVLDQIASRGEKVLIFCESLAMQGLLAAEIRRRYDLRHIVSRIHGGVAGDARQREVDAFQRRGPGFDAMILSPKAGGVGLTLTAANHVVHLSRWWNPAVEDQATDRAFRIGQTRDVTVYLPQSVHPDPAIAETSFDLKLHALMERKRALSRGLFAATEDAGDAAELFDAVVTDAAPVPAAVLPAAAIHPEPSAITKPTSLRERLSLRARPKPEPAVPPPRPAPTRASAWPQRVVYQPDTPRDLTIFTAPVAGDPPVEIHIVDPYAAAGQRARDATTAFVAMLVGESPAPARVTLTTYDGESIERPPETSAQQYEAMQARWHRDFAATPLTHRQRSKWQAADLHDREVRVLTRSGRTVLWDLGRGIDGVMSTRFGFRVNVTEI